MNTNMVITIARDAVTTLLLMGAPMLLAGAFIGIFMSMIQTVTQLKDQSLTFIPKIIGVLVVAIMAGPFLLKTILNFTNRIFLLAEKLGCGI